MRCACGHEYCFKCLEGLSHLTYPPTCFILMYSLHADITDWHEGTCEQYQVRVFLIFSHHSYYEQISLFLFGLSSSDIPTEVERRKQNG
jgi:hypothetical protein